MGLPRQIEQMAAEADEALEQDAKREAEGAKAAVTGAEDTPKDTPAAPADAAPPPAQEPPKAAPADPPVSEKDLQRMRSMLGRLSKSHEEKERTQREIETLRAEAEKARAERDEARARLERLQAEAPQPSATGGTDFTKEQLAKLRDVLNQNGADYSEAEVKPLAEAMKLISGGEAARVDAEIAEIRKERQEQRVAQFLARLNADFPGFSELDERRDPRWMKFLSGPMPEPMDGMTYDSFASDALARLDYRSFSWVVRQFLKQNASVLPGIADGASDAVRGQIRPASVPVAPGESHREQQRTRIPRSEIDAFYRAYYAKRAEARYGISAEQVAQRLALYEQAEAEDRVDEAK